MSKLQRLRDNIAAIEWALKGANDFETLSKYSGFGGMTFVLNPIDNKAAWNKTDLTCYEDTVKLHEVLRSGCSNEDEYKRCMASLKASTLTAYYTPREVVKTIDKVVSGSKFQVSSVLDPAAGSGAFLWLGKAAERVTAYEKDLLTALILRGKTSEHTDVRCDGFETIPDSELGSYDLVATNVPFGNIAVFDPHYTNSKEAVRREAAKMIHRYYVLKGLDCLRDGGILAYIITSNYLNNDTEQLRYALQQSRLIGAYRLANNLFKDAGTEVGTDLLVLQKDTKKQELTDDECLLLTSVEEQGCPTNMYFMLHPDHVIATSKKADTDPYGKPGFVYEHKDGVKGISSDMAKALAKDMALNAQFIILRRAKQQSRLHNSQSKAAAVKPVIGSAASPVEETKAKRMTEQKKVAAIESKVKGQRSKAEGEKIKALKALHAVYVKLYEYEQEYQQEDAESREELNRLYDAFVNEYGYLHKSDNRKDIERLGMVDLLSLEVQTEVSSTGEAAEPITGSKFQVSSEWQKADIMLKPVAFSTEEALSTLTAEEALAASLNEYGRVDMPYMEERTQKPADELAAELQGKIFFNPLSNNYEIAAKFLSGDVISKAEKIEAAIRNNDTTSLRDNDIAAAIAALRAAIPTPIPFEQLDFNLGERWMADGVYAKFASDFFSMPEDPTNHWRGGEVTVNVKYEPLIDQYAVECRGHSEKVWTEFSVLSEASNRLDGMDLLTHALQNSCPKMMRYARNSNGQRIINDNGDYVKEEDPEKTQQANNKIEEIRQGYVDWLQQQPKEFRDNLADAYNRRFNCFAKPKYDGSHQTFPGLDRENLRKNIKGFEDLYQSQKDCIWMLLLNGGGICDHEVGGGKTLIMCIAAHEMKRLGMCHKPMIIGLKANVSEIAKTYQMAYPQAKILYANATDYCAKNRVEFFNKMKNNDWDCVIMSHEQFGMIPQSDRVQKQQIEDELQQLEDALELLAGFGYTITSKMRRGLETRKRNLNAKLQALHHDMNAKKDDVVDFEMMGIDHIFVDESHQFKNLAFSTRHDRVAGIGNTEGSKRATNLLMAVRTIQQRTGKDLGASFFSGTTVTNSLTELYALFRYLRPEALRNQNITCFDAWAAIFTKKSQEYEFSITNSIVLKERFRYFIKVPELAQFYNEVTDFRTAEDVGLDRPGKRVMLLNIKPTPDQEDFMKTLMEFAKTGDFSLIGINNPTDKQRKAKMLYATDLARKMSMDMRLIDPQYGDHPRNKANQCAKQIAKYYEQYDEWKGTQMVFSDLSTWQKDGGWNIYSEIKRILVQEFHIPSQEIRFIQEAQSEKAKQKMIDDTNEGKIRVLFGSTTMLGTGVNAQQRVVAVHHLDTPWRPSDLEQRDGRAVRKGNLVAKYHAGNKVDIIIYAVERSLDSYKFNLLHCKQTFINQLKRGQLSIRTLDEGAMDEKTGMNFAEFMAVLSGNTDLLERAKLEKKIAGLESERKNFLRARAEQEAKIAMLTKENERHEQNIADAKADLARFNQARQLNADGSVLNDLTINGFFGDAGLQGDDKTKALGTELLRINDEVFNDGDYQEIGSIYGFPVVMRTERKVKFDGTPVAENLFFVKGARINYQHNYGKLYRGSWRLAAGYPLKVLEQIPTLIAEWETWVEQNRISLRQLGSISTQAWSKEAELQAMRKELQMLDKKINDELKKEEQGQMAKAA